MKIKIEQVKGMQNFKTLQQSLFVQAQCLSRMENESIDIKHIEGWIMALDIRLQGMRSLIELANLYKEDMQKHYQEFLKENPTN